MTSLFRYLQTNDLVTFKGLIHQVKTPEHRDVDATLFCGYTVLSPAYARMRCFFTFETQTKPGVYTKFHIDYGSTAVFKSVPVSCLSCLARTK